MALLLVACGASPVEPQASPAPTRSIATPAPAPAPASRPNRVRVAYRMEVGTSDPATADFADVVRSVLTDRRGWRRAGFDFVEDPSAEYRIVLAEGRHVDQLCLPLDTYSKYSCQNGPVVALNADRWRSATRKWTGDLDSYRIMLINHEVGHLLHMHHPTVQCPGRGFPAPVMSQQSTELGECRPNPWPLRWEIGLAARRLEPLAPAPEHDSVDHRPTPPAVRR